MKLREEAKGVLGIVLFYLVIIVGIILLSNNAQKSVDAETSTPHTNVNYKVNK